DVVVSRYGPVQRVLMQGVWLNLPSSEDCFFYRVVRGHIEPFPPLCDLYGPDPVPLLALCLPFTPKDQMNYANKHALCEGGGEFERMDMALLHLRQNLPQKYTRWVTIDGYTRAVVLASNRAKSDLSLAFDLDMLEKIRRLMGVRWVPTWNFPEGKMVPASNNAQPDIREDLIDWPEDLPSLPSLTWKEIEQLEEPEWSHLWNMVEVRLEMRARVKGAAIPGEDVPMSEAFELEEPVYE
ncbi:hypothetical protein BKA70DRAFT_1290794, partial [Coprinopsis sp. MPI-PUGE-AT-0042]